MTIDALIRLASEHPLRAEDIEATAAGSSVVTLYDLFAKRVAQRYLNGELSYNDADAAMNALFGSAYGPAVAPEFSRLAWQGHEAFDEGEYLHPGEPVEEQGEVKTRCSWLALLNCLRSSQP